MIVLRTGRGKGFGGPAWHLSVVTGSIWPEATGFPQVGVANLLIVWHPGMCQKTDALRQVSLNSHLLTIEESNAIPPFAAPCNGSWKARIQIETMQSGFRALCFTSASISSETACSIATTVLALQVVAPRKPRKANPLPRVMAGTTTRVDR